jgi:FAD/FMN-containing dehydrogenase
MATDLSFEIRAAYPDATWDGLRAVKATYDPPNLFRGNQNLPPAE